MASAPTGEQRGRTERRTVALGLVAAPGVAHDLAARLARGLPSALEERYPGTAWELDVRDEPLAAASTIDVDLVQICRQRMLEEGWDLVVCLTELPLFAGRRPVTAYASRTHRVGLVSVPALGPVDLDERVEEAVLRAVDSIAGEQLGRPRGERAAEPAGRVGAAEVRDAGTVRFVGEAVQGNLRLLLGMVRANRPWRLIAGLSRALVTALGAGAFGIVSPGVWHVADGLGWLRLFAISVAAVVATCASLMIAHGLWERVPRRGSPETREKVALVNLATTLTIAIGVLTLFVALFVISALCAGAVIATSVMRRELGHPVDLATYLRIAVLISVLATLGGALGSALESDRAVREAAYGYRPDD